MKNILLLILLHNVCFEVEGQIPSTKAKIQSFIDSVGNTDDRQSISASMFPAFANGKNFEWKTNIWTNKKHKLLWVEHIIPDSISTVFFYCRDTLVFVSELTYKMDARLEEKRPIFRNIFFYKSKILEDSSPGRNSNTVVYYIDESRRYLKLSKKTD